MRRRTAVLSVSAGVLFAVTSVAGATTVVHDRTTAQQQPAAAGTTVGGAVDPLAAAVTAAQRRLEQVPGDWTTWAALGTAYVEQARVTADPSYYDKADGALARSLALRPDGNDAALAGQAALANARHDFRAAAALGEQVVALNPFSATGWGVLTDARTQLGDTAGATAALQRMLELDPGIASFTRASYDAELRGDRVNARWALEQALATAQSPADEAWCHAHLATLALADGDRDEAAAQVTAGLLATPGDPSLLLVRARVDAGRGDVDAALAGFRAVVEARPLPENVVEYGEYLESLGRDAEAAQQYAVVDTVRRLFAAGGVADDLSVALFAADHGDPGTALAAATAERERRQNTDSADALAWALHSAGRDAEALPLAEEATALGGAGAVALYHRGAIEAALGLDDRARATLTQALDTNPSFSPLLAPRAQQLLDSLAVPA
ncbi:tetratricopeptide repeat protein [Modestobacter sp. I12A-02628]|uniref:Tetratricopeptide repeat protein n=1 Tax=Goekera deserti TaxID=2497753 RepID=A0A7K3WBU5_9ACTN|nr:tetratricopeptide repeat protein [Goekera deserti]MPQ98212.1 tetratricopeptide repeat protein [Goekera deserti]NDI48038.1 hypothetical protein [Goekera deserti]NEL53786.1 tetratricopeptide repeat protein [Goekera deserti]